MVREAYRIMANHPKLDLLEKVNVIRISN